MNQWAKGVAPFWKKGERDKDVRAVDNKGGKKNPKAGVLYAQLAFGDGAEKKSKVRTKHGGIGAANSILTWRAFKKGGSERDCREVALVHLYSAGRGFRKEGREKSFLSRGEGGGGARLWRSSYAFEGGTRGKDI